MCMVKICDESLVKPLFNIFQFSLETGNFPSNWKRGSIVSVHKKNNKCQNQVGFDKQNSQLCVYMSSPFRGFVTTKNSS